MKILAIETSTSVGSVGLLEDDRPVAERLLGAGLVHGRNLVPSIQSLLAERGWALADLGLVAVSAGPGSYTGLRIGVSCAKTLARFSPARPLTLSEGGGARRSPERSRRGVGGGLPLVAVGSLEALAENATAEDGPDTICPVLDARWSQVYAQLFRRCGAALQADSPPLALSPRELASRLPSGLILLGDGLKAYSSLFSRKGWIQLPEVRWYPSSLSVGRIGYRLYREGRTVDPFQLVPEYLRPTEAELKRQTRSADR